MHSSERGAWATPRLVTKPVSQTLGGTGADDDGRTGEFQS
jgi:hypothetical protein